MSLRGHELKLLGLRGALVVDRRPVNEVVLVAGLEVLLPAGLPLVVEEVQLPEDALALQVGDGPPELLTRATYAIAGDPPVCHPRYLHDAHAAFWTQGEGWQVQVGDAPAVAVAAGDQWVLGGTRVSAVAVPLAGTASTAVDPFAPLRITVFFDSVRIERVGHPTVGFGGLPARVLSELVAMGGVAPWKVVAAEALGDEQDEFRLRTRWDKTLARLRQKLEAAGIYRELVRSLGTGQVELVRQPGDEVIDET